MLQPTLQFIRDSLDTYLRQKFGLAAQVVVVNHVLDANGEIPARNQNKVIISLLNVVKEQVMPRQQVTRDSYDRVQVAHRYNLDLLITSHFDGYDTSLKFLDTVLLFFQQNPIIDNRAFPNLPSGIDKLVFEMENLSLMESQNLWSAMGAKYQPSVVFRSSLINLQTDERDQYIPTLENPNVDVSPE